MQRNMDLVRTILVELEKHPHGLAPSELVIDGFTAEEIGYHGAIMMQADLVKGVDITNGDSLGPEARVTGLTWQGHEFLDASRQPGVWAQAKETISKAGGASFQVWLAVLTELVKHNVGLS